MNAQFAISVEDDGAVATLPDCPTDRIFERRSGMRNRSRLRACLIPLSRADAICCETDDLGEGGIHVTIPVGYGVGIGERFELRLAAPGATLGMGPLLTPPGHFATVVRTRLQVGSDCGCVGLGLRFDRPLAATLV